LIEAERLSPGRHKKKGCSFSFGKKLQPFNWPQLAEEGLICLWK